MSEPLCILLARRREILNNRKAPIRLEIDNPYRDADGNEKLDASGNAIDAYRIYERRKAEILQYNNTSSVQGKLIRAQRYKQTVENIGRTSNQIVENEDGTSTTFGVATCPDDIKRPTSSSAAGIPGPSFTIQYRPEVPLYGYATNAQQLGIPNIGSLDAWSFNTGTNIQSPSGDWTTLVRIFHNIDNIDSEQVNKEYKFNMDIPIGLYVAGDISGVAYTPSNNIFITNIEVQILDHLGNVLVLDPQPVLNYTFNDISMNYIIDNSENFNAIQYLGILPFSTTLNIEPLSYYEIQLKFGIENDDTNDYETESYVSSVYTNLTSNNVDLKTNIEDVSLVGSGVPVPTHADFTIEGTALT
tara:strand:- start:1548 stop:2621 length:1074 start_codon:yes stop_codon:yes gene_type:complete